MGKRVTIAQVASYLGVAKSTVSHALSGKRPISEEVCEKVEKAVRELKYRPNFAATALNFKKMGLIGVLAPRLDTYYDATVVSALSAELARHQLQMVLALDEKTGNEEKLLAQFSSGMVDAVISTLPSLSDQRAGEIVADIPFLTFLRHQDAPLRIDFADGVRQAMMHLFALGHKRIGIVPSLTRSENGQADPCLLGYLEVAAEFGMEPTVFDVGHDCGIEEGVALADTVFASGATALLASNDSCAAGIIQRAIALGKPIPESLSIVGHDDSPAAKMTFPTLSTIRLPIDILVAHTVQLLLHRIDPDHAKPVARTVTPQLVLRNSTGKPNQE